MSTIIIKILRYAKKLTERGFVPDRECDSAVTRKGKPVSFISASAYKFSPHAAILRAEHDLLKPPSKLRGRATKAYVNAGRTCAMYRDSKLRLKFFLEGFEIAIENTERSAATEFFHQRTEQQIENELKDAISGRT
jgi:hypothetical protein